MIRRTKYEPLRPASWPEAMEFFIDRFREAWGQGHQNLACYNSGQLTIEELYTLGKLWRGGLQSSNIDGNTRLCTATSATGLMANFGTDGPVASYVDIDQADLRTAAKLDVSQPALSHTIRGLEGPPGLSTRTTRRVSPTRTGERLIRSVGLRFYVIEAERAALSELRETPASTIRITTAEHAPDMITQSALARLLPQVLPEGSPQRRGKAEHRMQSADHLLVHFRSDRVLAVARQPIHAAPD